MLDSGFEFKCYVCRFVGFLQLFYNISAAYFLSLDESSLQGIVNNITATFGAWLVDNRWFQILIQRKSKNSLVDRYS